ncbi:uncharacterized protein RCC_02712 [Ramularia collo-cygni]|uniref:Uncharacterized protein n=1 Tax=Ramularia collo-cygni TaxID=112498 RepID=A0A2D3UX72_9PEZI|nr:uncharacterized protein RCC_02712 [Ramularia collo-cygni]CZT16877.1 uncharacterized protein RCC_02712 [Ramularia collo-cygni]
MSATYNNPFFAPEFTGEIIPISLEDPILNIFADGKFDLNCPGSATILKLFAHIQLEALHLTHTILLSTPTFLPISENNTTTTTAHFPEPHPSPSHLTPQETHRTLYYLSLILPQIDVIVSPTTGSASGMTFLQPHRPLPILPGCGSTIAINPQKITKLTTAFQTSNEIAQQILMFDLAILLTHELAHALVFAVLPRNSPSSSSNSSGSLGNAFLGTATADEIGFEFERRLWGGLISMDVGAIYGTQWWNHYEYALTLREWPNPHILDSYAASEDLLTIHTREEMARVGCVWRVSFEYVNRMFRDEFWRGVVGGGGGMLCMQGGRRGF